MKICLLCILRIVRTVHFNVLYAVGNTEPLPYEFILSWGFSFARLYSLPKQARVSVFTKIVIIVEYTSGIIDTFWPLCNFHHKHSEVHFVFVNCSSHLATNLAYILINFANLNCVSEGTDLLCGWNSSHCFDYWRLMTKPHQNRYWMHSEFWMDDFPCQCVQWLMIVFRNRIGM